MSGALTVGLAGADAAWGRCAVQRDSFIVTQQTADLIEWYTDRTAGVLWYDAADTLPVPHCEGGYRLRIVYAAVEQVTQVGWRSRPIPPADAVEPRMLAGVRTVVLLAPVDRADERERVLLARLPGWATVDRADLTSGAVGVGVRVVVAP